MVEVTTAVIRHPKCCRSNGHMWISLVGSSAWIPECRKPARVVLFRSPRRSRSCCHAERRIQSRIARWYFTRAGRRFPDAAAREAAQLPDLIPHDLRRSAVRQMERARVPRQVAMRLVGHRTESIYRRYAIVSEADVMAAGASLDAIPVAGAIVTKSLQNKRRHSASKRGLPKNINKWCRGRGSNPHAPFRTQDFKSCASASSATPACSGIRSLRGLLFARARFVPAFCSYDVIVEAIDAFAELRSAGDGVAAIHAFP